MARVIEHGMLSDLLMPDEPRQIDDLRQEFEFLVETVIQRKDLAAIAATWLHYHEFMTYAPGESREYGGSPWAPSWNSDARDPRKYGSRRMAGERQNTDRRVSDNASGRPSARSRSR